MNATPYMPLYKIHEILKAKAKELNPKSPQIVRKIWSMWFYDKETATITICTNSPGPWIGRMGLGVEELKDRINAAVKEHNEFLTEHNIDQPKIPEIKIAFIECDC